MDTRQEALKEWLESHLQTSIQLQPVVGDASFRRYFRFHHQAEPFIAMDSPPEKEDCKPFITIAHRLAKLHLDVPKIIESDDAKGFLLISDLGDALYHYQLTLDNADQLYKNALRDLLIIHEDFKGEHENLPHFGHAMMQQELHFFTEWFLEKYLGLSLNEDEQRILKNTYDLLLENAITQPQTFVHRDYHSRNLMILSDNRVGILDFQDAVVGPITYDLVSLIRDCYVDWPVHQVEAWALDFHQALMDRKLIDPVDRKTFMRWFDLMGMQRHLKAIFIFARKYLRDGNDFYLQFIPRALRYVELVCDMYPELAAFQSLLGETILPAWEQKVVA